MIGDGEKHRLLWSPYSQEELKLIEERKKSMPSVKELDLEEELRSRDIVVLRLATAEDERESINRWGPEGPVLPLGGPEWTFEGTSTLRFVRRISDPDGIECALLESDQALAARSKDGSGVVPKGVLMRPILRILVKERPQYLIELAPLMMTQDESAQRIPQADIGPFSRFVARLPRRMPQDATPKEYPVHLIGASVQFATTLPGPLVSLPYGVIVNEVKFADGEEWFSEGYVVKLASPLAGPDLGIASWKTDQVVISPRHVGDRVQYGLDPDYVGHVAVTLLLPLSEKKVIDGSLNPEDVIPYAAAQLVAPGTAPPGAIDGTYFYGVPRGELPEKVDFKSPEDEDIPELYPDPSAVTKMRIPANTAVYACKPGTPADEVEKETGKKMKLYGMSTDPRKGWLYIAEEDDRLVLSSHAKEVWNDYRELAKVASLAMKEGYHKESEEILTRILELKPGNRLVKCVLAGAKAGLGKFEEAEKMLNDVLAVYPFAGFPKVQLAKVYLLQDKYQQALEVLNEACIGRPDDKDRLILLYSVYAENLKNERQGRWRMLSLAANFLLTPGPMLMLSALYSESNKRASLEFARGACERRLDDETVSAFSGVLGEAGRTDEAIGVIEHSRKTQKAGPRSLQNLAYAYELSKQPEKALDVIRELKKTVPPMQIPSLEEWERRLSALSSGGEKTGLRGIFRKKV